MSSLSLLSLSFWYHIITLKVSDFAYSITNVLEKSQNGELDLKIPENFKIDLGMFLDQSIDLTMYNEGNGMSFDEICTLIEFNKEETIRVFGADSTVGKIVNRLRIDLAASDVDGDGTKSKPMQKVFLTHHRSIQRDVACVYSLVKDT